MNSSKTILFLLLAFSLVFMMSCDTVKGSRNSNINPTIEITSYQGDDALEFDENGEVSIEESFFDTLSFQQQIFWHGWDTDGVVEGYAFRISQRQDDGNYVPVSVPVYEHFDSDGWVYHYKDGMQIEEGQELGDNDYSTIWSNLKSTTINFPANLVYDRVMAGADSTSGFLDVLLDENDFYPFKIEIKCVDDRGGESDIVEKNFFTKTYKPSAYISTSNGQLDPLVEDGEITYKRTGTGIEFEFTMTDNDQYAGNDPYYFDYWLDKGTLDANGEFILTGEASPKYTTFGHKDVERVILKEHYANDDGSRPTLVPDTYIAETDTFTTYTRMVVQAYDYAQVASEKDTVIFNVADFFNPKSVIYINRVFCVGSLHYANDVDESIDFIIPDMPTAEGIHHSTPFYIDSDTLYTALHSDDFRVYMQWGWQGEYVDNNKANEYLGNVEDEQLGIKYFSDIEYFDLQLDGEYYDYPALADLDNGNNIIEDEMGTWLRVPKRHDIGQETVLTNLEPGIHTFTVRAVDLQGKYDLEPTEFVFRLMDPHYNDKEGILVLDNDSNTASYSPDAVVDSFYTDVLDFYGGTIEVLDRDQLMEDVWNSELHFGKAVFAPSDLVPYKTVIYHADSPDQASKFNLLKEEEVISAYLKTGGNLIISSGAPLDQVHNDYAAKGFNLFTHYYGIATDDEAIDPMSNSIQVNPYFIGANSAETGYPNVDLNLAEPISPILTTLLGMYQGLGLISYFNPEYLSQGTETIYTLNTKSPTSEAFPPSQEEYDLYQDKPVAIKSHLANTDSGLSNKMYLFGFPLSYMDKDSVREMLQKIISDIEMR